MTLDKNTPTEFLLTGTGIIRERAKTLAERGVLKSTCIYFDGSGFVCFFISTHKQTETLFFLRTKTSKKMRVFKKPMTYARFLNGAGIFDWNVSPSPCPIDDLPN
jgi:hypothetical protein